MNQMDGEYRCQHSSSHFNTNRINSSSVQSKAMPYSCLPAIASVVPAIPKKTLPSSSAISQERESWIRSAQITNINDGTDQKTQYLEKMLRMQSWIRSLGKPNGNDNAEQRSNCSDMTLHTPQQSMSSMDSPTFDRIRFADQQIPAVTTTTSNPAENNDDEISIIEDTLFNNQVQSDDKLTVTNSQSTLTVDEDPSRWSGFLIDCDEVEFSPASPLPCPVSILPPPLVPTSSVEIIQTSQEDLNKRSAMLVYEFDTADAEARQQSKRKKQLNKNLQKKNKPKPKPVKLPRTNSNKVSATKKNNHHELPSDWIIEYDAPGTDQISQPIKETSTTMTVEEKTAKINELLEKMKEHQTELKKLRQQALSLLNEEPKSNSIDTNEQNISNNQDRLLHFLNGLMISGCWLCSGKTYTEVASQCNN